MARKTHPMGLLSMLVLLVAIIAIVPWILRTLIRTVSGFEDSPSSGGPSMQVPSVSSMGSGMRYVPDRNTDYLCRSPNDNGVPCPEGEFCDGTTQSCQKKTVPSTSMITGYFA